MNTTIHICDIWCLSTSPNMLLLLCAVSTNKVIFLKCFVAIDPLSIGCIGNDLRRLLMSVYAVCCLSRLFQSLLVIIDHINFCYVINKVR